MQLRGRKIKKSALGAAAVLLLAPAAAWAQMGPGSYNAPMNMGGMKPSGPPMSGPAPMAAHPAPPPPHMEMGMHKEMGHGPAMYVPMTSPKPVRSSGKVWGGSGSSMNSGGTVSGDGLGSEWMAGAKNQGGSITAK
jgi:hypothetical protein